MAYLVAVMVVVAAALVPVSAGKTYIVGDRLGWTVPPEGVVAYSNWASQHKFMAGDILGNLGFHVWILSFLLINKCYNYWRWFLNLLRTNLCYKYRVTLVFWIVIINRDWLEKIKVCEFYLDSIRRECNITFSRTSINLSFSCVSFITTILLFLVI